MFLALWQPLIVATGETLYMISAASFFAIMIGFVMGIFLFLTRKHQPLAHKMSHQILSAVINIGRSIPFVILMIAVIPVTRFIVGTSIGTSAAIVPLTIAAIPFFARMIENAFLEVSPGLIEAALSMGATTPQIIYKVLLSEAMPGIIRAITITVITLIGYSGMAGAVGGGGLGDLAIRYGYQRFDMIVMLETIVILVVMVQLVQMIGDYWVRRLLR